MDISKLVDLFVSDKQSESGAAPVSTFNSVSEGNNNSNWSDSLLDFIGRGAEIYKNFQGASTVVAPNTPASTTPGTVPKKNWLPWVIGGGVVLLLVVWLAKR